ncbi:MAG TPA: GTPase domain-containing protein [Xanthomonadaceae bacterium]|nr:GTPase domain-containing protein [Xanthomonadaceae bacterium]
MKRPTLPARLVLLLVLMAALVVGTVFVLMAADTALSVWERLQRAPWPFTAAIMLILVALLLFALRVAWWLLRPPRQRRTQIKDLPTREEVEARMARLHKAGVDTVDAEREIREFDRRAAEGLVHVALFGEINAGKSSLLKALAPTAKARIDVIGGSTDAIAAYSTQLTDGSAVVLTDLPGLNQAGDSALGEAARAEALRAHVVVYVCDGDLKRSQRDELAALAALDKPLLVALNKTDRYTPAELDALRRALAAIAGVDRVVEVSAGGTETRLRRDADGAEFAEEHPRAPSIDALDHAIRELARAGFDALEPGRETAVLGALDRQLADAEDSERERQAGQLVRSYTRRAVVGALAAVAPGTDIVIQGALATALLRSLGRVYQVPVRDLDADAFLARAGGTVRTTTSITLAIAGNALKAFPGLGTVAGGLVHALAYGMIFDALGRAVAETLAQQRRFDAELAASAFARRVSKPSESRLRALASLALDEFRARGRRDEDEPHA